MNTFIIKKKAMVKFGSKKCNARENELLETYFNFVFVLAFGLFSSPAKNGCSGYRTFLKVLFIGHYSDDIRFEIQMKCTSSPSFATN